MLDDEQNNGRILEELEDNDNEDEMEYDISVINISNLPHPAKDKNAKWKLQEIFVENLGKPNYLSNFK